MPERRRDKDKPLDDGIAELLEGELDLSDDGEALGDLLGAPPPLPLPEDDVMSSAPRPAPPMRSGRAQTPPAPAPAQLPEAPTDEEVFAGTEEEVDAALLAVFGPSSTDASHGEFGEATKISQVDDELLRQAQRPEDQPRRGPAVVRRSSMPSSKEMAAVAPPDDAPAEDGDHSGEETTRIADEAQMAAQAQAEPPEPPPIDDFYDDIEIGAAPSEESPAAFVAPPRRLTQNVVRRTAPTAPIPAEPVEPVDEPSIRTVLEQAAALAVRPPEQTPHAAGGYRFPAQAAPVAVDDVAERIALYEAELGATDHPERIHYYLARAYEDAGDTARARAEYEEACLADHRFLPAVRGMRRLCVRLGDHKEMFRWLGLELELSGEAERVPLAAYRADLLAATGEQDLARVAYGELTDARRDDLRSLLAQLELAYSDDRDEEVIDVCVATAPLVGDTALRAALLCLAGRMYERAGRDSEAAQVFAASLESEPGNGTARLGLLRLALRRGEPGDAEEVAVLAGNQDTALRAAVARRRAAGWLAAGDPSAAAACLGEVGADDPLVLEQLANVHLALGQTHPAAVALKAWAQIESAPARRAEVLRLLSSLEGGLLGDAAAALHSLREAAAADPTDTDLLEDLGAAEETTGNGDAALALLRAAAAADPEGSAPYRLRAARLCAALGRTGDAIDELSAVLAVVPDDGAVIGELARLYERAGRFGELAALLQETAGIAPEGPGPARARAARAAMTAAEIRSGGAGVPIDAEGEATLLAAENAWREVLAEQPSVEGWDAMTRLAAVRGDAAAWEEALAGLEAAVTDPIRRADLALRRAALSPEQAGDALANAAAGGDARAAALLTVVLARAGDWDGVAAQLEARAEGLPPGPERDAMFYRAAAALGDGDQEGRAAELLGPIVEARPDFAGGKVRLERAYRRLGDAGALAALIGRDLEAEGEDPLRLPRLLRLAEVWSWRVGDAGRAAATYREALALRPGDPITRDGFSRVAAAAEELSPLAELALEDLRRAEESGDATAKMYAYEELARIDGDLRGDMASATLAWESVTALDPTRMPALRALERTYLSESRAEELSGLYGKLAAAVAGADAAPILLERARLHEQLGHASEAQDDFAGALAADPSSRPALFRLEMKALANGGPELAALEDRVADHFADDPRSRAAFMLRAGELYADSQPDLALARFRGALEVLPGYVPALRAWRRLALRHERWEDVAAAARDEASVAHSDAERAQLLHLSAVCAMDGAGQQGEAAAALQGVLAADPLHEDAFLRLRHIYEQAGRSGELAGILAARVDLEPDPARKIELHEALASLYRDVLPDAEMAKTQLRAILAIDRKHRGAVASLAEVAWAQRSWKEAEEALIVRARLEEDPDIRKDVFYRLGVIYADHLPNQHYAVKAFERVLSQDPNNQGALEYLARISAGATDFRTALAATERLVQLAADPAARVRHLHQVARIYDEGFKDRKRSEEALRRALDADPLSVEALSAVVDHYVRVGDAVTLRMNLDRTMAAMRFRLDANAWDAAAYRILARALMARGRAGHAGSLDAGRCAAELAVMLGVADDSDRAVAAEVEAHVPNVRALASLALDDTLFHPSVPSGFRQVFRLLYDTLGKRSPPDLRRHRVGRGEKLARGAPLRETIAAVATELGVHDVEVYASPQATLLAVELTDPVSIVIGGPLMQATPRALRFAAARALKLAVSYMAVPARLNAEELGTLVAAIIRQADPKFNPPGLALAAVTEEAQRLGRLIPKRLRDEILAYTAEISGVEFDHRALWLGVQHTGNRAGLLATGSVASALAVLLPFLGHADLRGAYRDPQVEELFRFAVSNEHCELRSND